MAETKLSLLASHGRHLAELEKELGHCYSDRRLLLDAVIHKSYFHENRSGELRHNERIEFLGDSVLGLVVVEYLYSLKRNYDESVLTKIKSYIVSEPVLAEVALAISLGQHVLLGKGEEMTGGREKQSILSNTLEAVIGALYLDAGHEKTREIVLRLFRQKIDRAIESGEFQDSKTELQERSQALHGTLPEYRVIKESGMDHTRSFTVEVFIGGKKMGVASGRRKKEAEARAAEKALEKLHDL